MVINIECMGKFKFNHCTNGRNDLFAVTSPPVNDSLYFRFLYFVLLSAWVIFNFINLWFKYRNVVLENKALELENKIKEEKLKQLRDENTKLDNRE